MASVNPSNSNTATTTTTTKKTVAFFGASGGCGLSALKHTLSAGYHCIALCRTPSKLTALFPAESTPNLTVVAGNAHDEAAVKQCLVHPTDPTALVDTIVFTIGSPLIISKMTTADPDVCKRGMAALLAALASLRADGGRKGQPRIVAISTTGISHFGRDVPLAMLPMYHALLRVPHADKRVMEKQVVDSGERYVLVRPSFLTDGETDKPVRVGVEDPVKGRESKAVGYVISREDVGRWMAESLVREGKGDEYVGKIVMVTY